MTQSMMRTALVFVLLFGVSEVLNSRQSGTFLGGPQRTLQFENDNVTVWKAVVPPNGPLTMHTHQYPRVIVALEGGVMKIVNEDGTSETHPWETGHAYWLPATEGTKRHADQNTGAEPIEVMVIEVKNAK